MAREQLNVGDLLPLLETSDLQQLDEVKGLINEHLSTERGSVLLNGLVDYFLETESTPVTHILCSVREPHDKHLFDKMNECMAKPACRLSTLTLLGHVVRKQPSWIHKIARYPLLLSLLRCLKMDTDAVVLITAVLVLVTLLPMIPQAGKQHLYEVFDIFGRLAAWTLRNPGHVSEVHVIHLHAGVYSLFHRLYGMYPCNFISYLRSHYSMKENVDTFEEVVKPMLEHVRIHPELVTGTKDHELDPTRWKKFEIHDIVIECAKVSLDPREASCEAGYSAQPEHFCAQMHVRPPDPTASPYPNSSNSSCEFNSTCGVKDVLWSPSSLCGMATPPSSRGMSPNPETSQSAFHLSGRLHSIQGGKGTPCSGTPAASSPPPNLADELSAASLSHSATSLPYRVFLSAFASVFELLCSVGVSAADVTLTAWWWMLSCCDVSTAALMEELVTLTEMKLRDGVGRSGFDSPFYRTTETLTGAREKPLSVSAHGVPPRDPHTATSTPDKAEARPGRRGLRYGPPLSPGPCRAPPLPYEALFDLTLPHAASVFVRHRTVAALDRADSEGGQGAEAGQGRGAQRPTTSASPLEVLDQLVQQGSMAHDCVLQRSPLPSKSADWTHFGGKWCYAAVHLQALRSQLLLLHNQLLFERYKREQHALRNRRLLRRIINTTALQEQNNAMKDQLNLQSVDIVSLRESLQVEQQRYRELCEEKEAVVSRLHAQIGQLQQDHDDYCTKNQELESKLQECQKRRRETEAELQTANNEVCHTGHLLKQLTAKLSSSESTQQQLGFLSRQLLLLGEAHKLCVQELQQSGPDTTKEVEMLKASATKEVEHLKLSLLLQGQKLEAAQQRAAELETQLSKKEHLIAEQKLFLEDVKCQAKEELQASESRYQAQRSLTQAFHTELLQLYSRDLVNASNKQASVISDPSSHPNPETKSINGSRDTPPPVLVEPPPPRPHTPLGPPGPSAPPAAPLTVGSYPSAKSFLGMRARELFRNKSESQCDEGDALRPQFTSLSQGLKTELCVEPPVKTAPGPAHTQGPAPSTLAACDASQKGGNQGGAGFSGAPAPPRQQQLRIMDYNESHLDHS
uniref:TSC complex subunit 1b n=1 Tax=Electrophorus electricus TaxID=8005 RepID=A0AAY5EKB9_ELEEL